MAKILANLARMTTSTTGTGTITLGSAASSGGVTFLTFAQAGVADGDVVTYAIADTNASEIGRGTYTSSGTTLTRTVLKSTNSNSAINLSGNAQVFITPAAEDIPTIAVGKTLNISSSLTLAGTDGTTMTFPPASASVGYLNIPINSQSAAYTTVLADSGKCILHPSADTSARTWTIDSNANVPYPVGTVITFVNQVSAGVITIAITSDTLYLAGAGTTGSRTLAANGVASAIKMTTTTWIISGAGLT